MGCSATDWWKKKISKLIEMTDNTLDGDSNVDEEEAEVGSFMITDDKLDDR